MARISIYDLPTDNVISKDEMRRIRGGLDVSRKKGYYSWKPEVGDEVILSFVSGDMRAPIVLGSLWESKDPPVEKDSE
ncbi:MAG: hypothetical protein JXB48_02900 [Candidatus Latescibacteria bacterium]|nr:hypothetical protein [Candidatus Latescibacterota bacterium]